MSKHLWHDVMLMHLYETNMHMHCMLNGYLSFGRRHSSL